MLKAILCLAPQLAVMLSRASRAMSPTESAIIKRALLSGWMHQSVSNQSKNYLIANELQTGKNDWLLKRFLIGFNIVNNCHWKLNEQCTIVIVLLLNQWNQYVNRVQCAITLHIASFLAWKMNIINGTVQSKRPESVTLQ